MTLGDYLFEGKILPLLRAILTRLLSSKYGNYSKLACMGLITMFMTYTRVMRGRLSRYIVFGPSMLRLALRQAQGPWDGASTGSATASLGVWALWDEKQRHLSEMHINMHKTYIIGYKI